MPNLPLQEKAHHTLLVLEQPPLDAADLCGALGAAGWSAVRAADHLQGLESVRSGQIDLVLLCLPVGEAADLDLPGVLRRLAPCDYLPVVILTDRPAEQFSCRFLDSGADEILCLGDSRAQIVSRLRALLRVKDCCDRLAESRRRLRTVLCHERRASWRLRRDNASLRDLAATDPLTGLSNRRSFEEALDHEFKVARRYGRSLSLLLLDVDHFKAVNDECGHPAGDRALKHLAAILRQCVRESDLAARTGGDELAVVMPNADREQALALGERIRREVRARPVHAAGRRIELTVSAGLATWPADALITSPAGLVRAADSALLRAKTTRDRVEAFGKAERKQPMLNTQCSTPNAQVGGSHRGGV